MSASACRTLPVNAAGSPTERTWIALTNTESSEAADSAEATCSNGRKAIGIRLLTGLIGLRVLDDADDLDIAGRAVVAVDAEAAADRVAAGEEAADERFVHDGDARRTGLGVSCSSTARPRRTFVPSVSKYRGETRFNIVRMLSRGCGV